MPVKVGIDGNRVIADIPYDNGRGPKQAKQVPGYRAKWDKKVSPNKFLGWTYPLTIDTCYKLRRVFGQDLLISNELADWARSEIAKMEKLEEFREGKADQASRLERVSREAPQLYLAMMSRGYQPQGTAFMVTAGQSLLGDDPGLGKTLQALAAIIESDARMILVTCPSTATYSVWSRETNRWAPSIMPFVAQGTRSQRDQVMRSFLEMPHPGRKMLICNTEMMRAKRVVVCPEGRDPEWCDSMMPEARGDHRHTYLSDPVWPFLFEQAWDAIIVDESHDSLAGTANIQSKRITQVRYGAVQLRRRLREGGLAIALSGTPARSKLDRFWGTLNWLRPDVFTSFWAFAERQFGVTTNGFARVVGYLGDDGKQVVEPVDQKAFERELRPYYLVRRKADVLKDLPPILYAGTPINVADSDSPCYVQIPMSDKQSKAYRQIQRDGEADINGGRVIANGVLAELTRMRQFANCYGQLKDKSTVIPDTPSNKLDWILDFMYERQGGTGKVVIASSFTELVELIASHLRKAGWEVLTLTGATSIKDRTRLQERFQDQDDPLRVVVINRKAGGQSITLDAADEMVITDLPWISDDDDQLENRIHRVSRIHQVTIYRLVSTGTVDEWMAGLTDEQRRILRSASPRKLSDIVKESGK